MTTVRVKLTHKRMKHDGAPLFVEVGLQQATLDTLATYTSDSLEYKRAASAVCARFRQSAGKKYFSDDKHGGVWPQTRSVSIESLDIVEVDPPRTTNRASQSRGPW